jgi:flagellar basal-body rod protein FlgG
MLVRPFNYSTWETLLGTMAQEHRVNITSNNLANVNTAGFKRDVPIFDGYIVAATKTDFRQGSLRLTENKYDLALSGPGFFQIETPQGIRYTRNGSFILNSDGRLVTLEGNPVVADRDIEVPEDTVELNVTSDGVVYADGQLLGELELVEFEDPNVLAKEGYNNFVPKVDGVEGEAAENTSVEQGYLEMANADPVLESVNLIDTLRTYEVFQKIVHTFSEANEKCVNEVGRLT